MTDADHENTSSLLRIGVGEFEGDPGRFLREARQGRSFLVMSRDEAIAEIRPPSGPSRPRREPGALRGRIRMAPDFDTLPPEVLAAMETGEG